MFHPIVIAWCTYLSDSLFCNKKKQYWFAEASVFADEAFVSISRSTECKDHLSNLQVGRYLFVAPRSVYYGLRLPPYNDSGRPLAFPKENAASSAVIQCFCPGMEGPRCLNSLVTLNSRMKYSS